jgi:hypothetical protein
VPAIVQTQPLTSKSTFAEASAGICLSPIDMSRVCELLSPTFTYITSFVTPQRPLFASKVPMNANLRLLRILSASIVALSLMPVRGKVVVPPIEGR